MNPRGVAGARLIGAHIRDYRGSWDALLASPAARVADTLAEARIGIEPTYDERLYLGDAPAIREVVRERAGAARAVLVAGHNPGLQELLLALVPPNAENALFDAAAVKFPTGSFAVLELAIGDWAALNERCGALVHFTRPRDLDSALGPEVIG